MPIKKRRHYLPKAYLKAFTEKSVAFWRDEPREGLHLDPEATGLERIIRGLHLMAALTTICWKTSFQKLKDGAQKSLSASVGGISAPPTRA